jgi:hypothetical protein
MNSDYRAVFNAASDLITMLAALEGKWTADGRTADAAKMATLREGVADLFDVKAPEPEKAEPPGPGETAPVTNPGIGPESPPPAPFAPSVSTFGNVSRRNKRDVPPDEPTAEGVPIT